MINHKVSSGLGYGCVALATYNNLAHSLDILNLAFDMGIIHFDTAPLYSKGYSEKILGIFSKNKRDKVQISSKFGLGDAAKNPLPVSWAILLNKQRSSAPQSGFVSTESETNIIYRQIDENQIDKNLDSTLKRLKTDYLDCFLLHEGISPFLTDEAKAYLLDLKKAGKIKKIGLAANFNHTQQDPDLDFWDILQYENGPFYNTSDGFVQEYPKHEHIYHSCFKQVRNLSKKKAISKDYAGLVLAYEHKKNPNGKILFSTGNDNHLKHNILTFRQYVDKSEEQLKDMINYALS